MKRGLPRRVTRYLRELCIGRFKPFCLVLDAQGRLKEWHRDGAVYGFTNLTPGIDLRSRLTFLEGMSLAEPDPQLIRFLQIADNRSVDVHVLPVDGGCCVLFVDVSEEWRYRRGIQQKANELELVRHRQDRLIEQLEQTQAELEVRRRQAEQANTLKGRFIAGFSHELRTPLTSIMGFTRLLKDQLADNPQTVDAGTHLRAIQRASTHLLSFIDNLLDEASLEAGQFDLHPVPSCPQRVFAELEEMFSPLADEKGLQLQAQSGSLPANVSIDETRFRQCLINLLGNAVKFTPSGHVRFTLEWRDGCLFFSIEDSGPGIPAEAHARVFLAFHREQSAQGGRTPGTGLGLPISQMLIERMGGCLKLSSDAGKGSRFHGFVEAPLLSLPEARVEQAGPASQRQATILVAEDDENLRQLFQLQLGNAGYQVIFAENGEEAVTLTLQEHPDLVVMDRHMPVLDGLSATRRLRSMAHQGPIIAVTASSSSADHGVAIDAGCDAFVPKQSDPAPLLETINQLLCSGTDAP